MSVTFWARKKSDSIDSNFAAMTVGHFIFVLQLLLTTMGVPVRNNQPVQLLTICCQQRYAHGLWYHMME
jgi:hypothetical protein